MVKRVLMIAYHYPPVRGSSGLQRTLQFSRYLPEHDWLPIVLTVRPQAYSQTADDQLGDIPRDIIVKRAFALDAGRHLSIGGKFPGFLAWPDRWSSWWLGAVPAGLRLIKRYRPDIIWSTYPIATAHLIGLALRRLSGLPWVADFRDPMTEPDFPPDPSVRRVAAWIEARTVAAAARSVFTTSGAMRMYAERYRDVPAARWIKIPNGFDETSFQAAEAALDAPPPDRPLTLLHSGVLYPSERDPTQFFGAVARLKAEEKIAAGDVSIILRASGHDALYLPELKRLGIDDIVSLKPALPYTQALTEMLQADGLLLFQAANCNQQIPAKAYEYLRARRPVLALTDAAGDTAALLRDVGVGTIFDLSSENEIYNGLLQFLGEVKRGEAPMPDVSAVSQYSRQSESGAFARLLNEVANHAA